MILIAAVVAVVAVIGVVVALVVGGGDDSDDATATVPMSGLLAACSDDTASPTGGPSAPTGTIELAPFPDDDIFKPVAVEGEALPPFSPEVRSGEQPDTAWCRDAPIVAGYDYAGNRVTIDPATDGPTMVVLLAHWCPHCNAEIPVLNEWRDSGGDPRGLEHRRREHRSVAGRAELPAGRVAASRWTGSGRCSSTTRPPTPSRPRRRWGPTAGRRTPRWCSSTPTASFASACPGEVPIDVFAPIAEALVAES